MRDYRDAKTMAKGLRRSLAELGTDVTHSQSLELIAQARAEFPGTLATEVPYNSEIERMSVRRAPLPACAPRSPAARIYGALWAEICARTYGGQSAADAARTASAAAAQGPQGDLAVHLPQTATQSILR